MPNLYLIGGPNGAGKSTISQRLFPDILATREFVNADAIAKGLSAFNPESVAVAAGRLLLKRLHQLHALRKDFAFETTLASRSLVPFLRECRTNQYTITLVYVWIESAELAHERVQERVKQGGHSVPDDVIRRRYQRSISNLISLYLPLADCWRIYDNTYAEPQTVAFKDAGNIITTMLPERMKMIMPDRIHEPEAKYTANKIDLAVKAAVAEELDRKRKLGLPMVFGRDGKVVIMVGDTIVAERAYERQTLPEPNQM